MDLSKYYHYVEWSWPTYVHSHGHVLYIMCMRDGHELFV